jgi:uncharacterized protein (DUF58 family)
MRPREGPSARALGLAGAGCAALIASQGFGTAALATLGAGLVALPVIVTALVWAVAAGLTLRRRVEPARMRAGDELRVSLALTGWPARMGLDRLLRAWGARPAPRLRRPAARGRGPCGRRPAATTACRRRGFASPTPSAWPAAPGTAAATPP